MFKAANENGIMSLFTLSVNITVVGIRGKSLYTLPFG